MKYNSTSDIRYLDFEKFNDAIAERSEDVLHISEMIMKIFYPKYPIHNAEFCINQFSLAIKTPGIIQPYKFDLSLKKAANFIDLDVYVRDYPIDFLKTVLKNRFIFWRGIDINKVSLATAQHAFKLFMIEPPK